MGIIVCARKRDPKAYGVQKYDNQAAWNVPGGWAPNGVSATRYLRETEPNPEQLSPLAAWLVAHAPRYVAGRLSGARVDQQVCCYNGLTQAQAVRADAQAVADTGRGHVNGRFYTDPALAMRCAEGMLAMYGGLLDEPVVIDWLFDIIEPRQTDEAYWNATAERILLAGIRRVVIGAHEWQYPRPESEPPYAIVHADATRSAGER